VLRLVDQDRGFIRLEIDLVFLDRSSKVLHRAPANTGVFIYLNIPRSLKNSIQYLAPSPTSTANLEPL
jgi:hypothetical protein